MFLTECVLVYMEIESSSMLLQWIARQFNDVFFINYEQVCFLVLRRQNILQYKMYVR